MVGITAWNQQVPLPQDFTGENRWKITLHPEPAAEAVSGRESLFKGAIAVAANGVPIFNPIKQDGRTDTNLAGELDEYGGHAGRGDDYHYHLPPTFMNEEFGDALPIGYAMDGYALYGFNEPDGERAEDLDELNGHQHGDLGYHYHATEAYPYLNGGFRGEVALRDGQVAEQPRTRGVRPYTRPLRGAAITGYEKVGENAYRLEYDVAGGVRAIEYEIREDGSVAFEFIDEKGQVVSETYTGRDGGRGGKGERRRPGGGGRSPR
ncbi:MAG: YHYH protein [Verrucomicrobiota bacterium]